jgi:rod shape-determining protein MreC
MRTLLRFIQKYSNFLLFLVLETVAILFIVRDSGYQRSKIMGLNRQVSGYMFSRVDGAREYLYLKETNRQLAEENLELRNRLDRLTLNSDSAIVHLGSRDSYHYHYIPARVVRNSVFKQYNYLTLDKGKNHGVFRDMGVISDEGLVGIVLDASPHYSTVIPIINRDFRLSVKLKSSNYAGILQWEGGSPLYAVLNEIPYHVDLVEHDTIVTSGFSAIFPEGVMVGTIQSFSLEKGNFYEIKVKLSTDFQRLFHVNIIRNYRQEEQRTLEANTR